MNWRYKETSTPSEVQIPSAVDALKDATRNITTVFDNCGFSDTVSATHAYLGNTTQSTNIISSQPACGNGNEQSMVEFGVLPNGYVAVTCVFDVLHDFIEQGRSATIVESDMKLNSAGPTNDPYLWVANAGSGCNDKFAIRGVATHERGHSYGLGDIDAVAHPELTMGIGGPADFDRITCNVPGYEASGEMLASVGLGDYLGLDDLY